MLFRSDEIGVAEQHLAAMQRDLRNTLQQQRHLADLGLAVSKINHDLRNMLASAQLFSDRLGSLPDPTVQRFAPKLIGALDRAIFGVHLDQLFLPNLHALWFSELMYLAYFAYYLTVIIPLLYALTRGSLAMKRDMTFRVEIGRAHV